MKRIINLLILISAFTFVFLMVCGCIHYSCIFKRVFDIRCPGCGLTRSFDCILSLDMVSAIRYNILGISLFIILIVFSIMFILDIVKNRFTTINLIMKIFSKYYLVIVLILLITMVINNINGI